jgi:hypothetical protein
LAFSKKHLLFSSFIPQEFKKQPFVETYRNYSLYQHTLPEAVCVTGLAEAGTMKSTKTANE